MFGTSERDDLSFGAFFEASPNAYVVFDQKLTIVACNRAYLDAVGRASREDILGRYLFEAFPSPEDSPSYTLLRHSLDTVLETHERDYIAVIPYDTSGPGKPSNMRYWSATHTPIFDRDGMFRFILQHTVDVTELQALREHGAREIIAEAGVLRRAREVEAASQAIQAESQLLRDMFKQAPGFMGILAGPAHTFILANDAYQQLVGGRDLVGLAVAEALPEVVGQGFIDLLDQVYRSGEAYVGRNAAVKLRQPGQTAPDQLYLDFIYQPIFAEDGSVSGIFVQGHDVSDRVEAEHLHTLQQRELGHRLKNQLAMVQAIVGQTLRSATGPDAAQRTIGARLQALATAHDTLIHGTGGRTTVGEIVRNILEIHDDSLGRFSVKGPQLVIASRPALSLSLILNELATNAVKYGALSTESGVVSLAWGIGERGDGRAFVLTWRETGGPAVKAPERSGVGTGMIRAGLAGTKDCDVTIDFAESGVVCTLTADLATFQKEARSD